MMTELELGPGWRKVSLKEYGPFSPRERIVHYVNAKPEYWVYEDPVPPLPTEPGTVIGIDGWRYVLIDSPYDAVQAHWYLLAPKTAAIASSMNRANARAGAGYSAGYVLTKARESGGFRVLAEPVHLLDGDPARTEATFVSEYQRGYRQGAKAVLDRVRALTAPAEMRVGMIPVLVQVADEFGVE